MSVATLSLQEDIKPKDFSRPRVDDFTPSKAAAEAAPRISQYTAILKRTPLQSLEFQNPPAHSAAAAATSSQVKSIYTDEKGQTVLTLSSPNLKEARALVRTDPLIAAGLYALVTLERI